MESNGDISQLKIDDINLTSDSHDDVAVDMKGDPNIIIPIGNWANVTREPNTVYRSIYSPKLVGPIDSDSPLDTSNTSVDLLSSSNSSTANLISASSIEVPTAATSTATTTTTKEQLDNIKQQQENNKDKQDSKQDKQKQQQLHHQHQHDKLSVSSPANPTPHEGINKEINSGAGYKVNNSSYHGYRHNFNHSGYSLYTVNHNGETTTTRQPATSYVPYSPSTHSANSSSYSPSPSPASNISSYLYIDTARSTPSDTTTASDSLSSSEGYMYADSNHSSSSYLAYTTNNTEPIDIDVPLDHNTPKVNIWKEEERCQREDGQDYTWNEKFQYIMDLPEAEDKYKYLSIVANDFVYCANTFGKIIISERNLPEDQKTIKPLSLGGVAGGHKYKCQDIIFKFVVDVEIAPGLWMYGDTSRSDEKAQKSAGHELKGLNHFMEHSNGLIRFPLMAIIDYRGYRLLAISNLPITKKSIVYGSNDGGKTIHNSDPIIEKEMERLAAIMNTKGHMVGLTSPKLMYGPGDLEIHKGTDGRYYMLDFARAFPPEYPAHIHGKVGREIFYSMLRPELILKSDVPLSPDAFSGWQTGKDEDDSNQEVIEMTSKYHKTIIPECASYIQKALEEDTVCEASDDFFDSMFLKDLKRFVNCNSYNAYQQKSFELLRMVNLLHGRGINIRYLGAICQLLKDRTFKSILFTELVARVWKKLILAKLREKMDQTNRPSDEPKVIVAEVFDLLLNVQRSCEFKTFWSSSTPGNFKFAALRAFPNCLNKSERCNDGFTADFRSKEALDATKGAACRVDSLGGNGSRETDDGSTFDANVHQGHPTKSRFLHPKVDAFQSGTGELPAHQEGYQYAATLLVTQPDRS
ncbi:hypothetical protein PPL_11269 [Heterostelium album PN500]|uniref:Clu domain-containing protein n=1 Tax=Heterostelium pallidum (strain ATCC 26659 / Pp 5 / PN500) TaxID=670386 RepID=D3BU09_HETP5|nr:hypothetical protein PPL_11269 [Heterostelium album PN500]EFA75195.1 hypothetical protein PPL_11269 [Heterostelium album PN500]|eukprot:XP_020427329.1 hypothetical protein PPL_11269 [Heterostelium album PN500]